MMFSIEFQGLRFGEFGLRESGSGLARFRDQGVRLLLWNIP